MTTNNKGGARRLRWGAAVLASLIPLALPATASAVPGPTANSESIQYIGVNVNPPAGTQTATYDNSEVAKDSANWRSPFEFKYRLWNSQAPVITADNYAEADVSSCSHCGATSIAFQVVLVSKKTLASLTATDTAQGDTDACTTCNSLAEAFQIVYATSQWSQMSSLVSAACDRTAAELRELRYSGLSTTQIQSRSTADINNLISLLQGASQPNVWSALASWTPAINGASQASSLTSTTQPIVDLLSQIHH
jgi:hypothetical protein